MPYNMEIVSSPFITVTSLHPVYSKCYMVFWIAPFPVTLSDLQSYSPSVSLFKCDVIFRTIVQQLTRFQPTQPVALCRLSVVSEPLVLPFSSAFFETITARWCHADWLLVQMKLTTLEDADARRCTIDRLFPHSAAWCNNPNCLHYSSCSCSVQTERERRRW